MDSFPKLWSISIMDKTQPTTELLQPLLQAWQFFSSRGPGCFSRTRFQGWGGVGWGWWHSLNLHTWWMLRNRMLLSDLHTCWRLRNRMLLSDAVSGVGWGGVVQKKPCRTARPRARWCIWHHQRPRMAFRVAGAREKEPWTLLLLVSCTWEPRGYTRYDRCCCCCCCCCWWCLFGQTPAKELQHVFFVAQKFPFLNPR